MSAQGAIPGVGFNPWRTTGVEFSKHEFPCACGQQATQEKAGRCVCDSCAKNYNGRSFPLRRGNESSSVVRANLERVREWLD